MAPLTKAALAVAMLIAGYALAVQFDAALLNSAAQQIAGDFQPLTPPVSAHPGEGP